MTHFYNIIDTIIYKNANQLQKGVKNATKPSDMTSTDNALALFCGDFTFQQDFLTKYLICGVCNMVMRNPMRLHNCGHTFCDKCILTANCPDCLIPFQVKQPDLTAASLVADSMVRCLAKDCPFRGTYDSYISTHKNACKLKGYNGLQGWMDKVKESIDGERRPKKVPIHCDAISLVDTVPPQADPSVILQAVTLPTNRYQQIQSLIIQSTPKKIDIDSLYHIHPENEARVAQQLRQMKQKKQTRRCQYGKHCKLMLEEAGCPYLHPEKNPRRQYQLEQWANVRVVRPPNKTPELIDEINKKAQKDTQNFMQTFFPVHKIPDRKQQPQVEIVANPNQRHNKQRKPSFIQL